MRGRAKEKNVTKEAVDLLQKMLINVLNALGNPSLLQYFQNDSI